MLLESHHNMMAGFQRQDFSEREPGRSCILYDLGLEVTLTPFIQHSTGQDIHKPPPRFKGREQRLHLSGKSVGHTARRAHEKE